MRWHGAAFLVGCSFLGPACTTSKLTADDPHAASAPAPAPAAQPELTFDTSTDAEAPLTLGARCNAALDAVHCGTEGRVSVLVTMHNGFAPGPAEAPPCRYVELDPEHRDMFGGRGCVEGGRVYLAASCVMCRQASEWSMIGVVAEMTDRQIAAAQRQVGMAPAPRLRTTHHWRTALATAASERRRRR